LILKDPTDICANREFALSEPSTEDGGWAGFWQVPELTEQNQGGLVYEKAGNWDCH
jgi:hypothetical protein